MVAQGTSGGINSEAGKSETSGYAEEREEEHESVSEFVDHVLKEGEVSAESAEDLGMEREGYEEYGHMVELGDNGGGPASREAESGSTVAVAEKTAETAVEAAKEEKKEKFINDPFVNFAQEKQEKAVDEAPVSAAKNEERPGKMVTVPIELTEEEIRSEVPVRVMLDIRIHSD